MRSLSFDDDGRPFGRMVIELLALPQPSLPPPRSRGQLALALETHWVPCVLTIGSTLPPFDELELRRRGCRLHFVPDLASGLAAMTHSRWDAVAVNPTITQEADGLRFVRSFKCRPTSTLPESISPLATRYAATPFLILPLPQTTEFAIFWSATDWTLLDTATDALCRSRRELAPLFCSPRRKSRFRDSIMRARSVDAFFWRPRVIE